MIRKSRLALVALAVASGAFWGCGSESDGTAQRSEEAVKTDNRGQDAMMEFMRSKKGGSKKAAAKKEEAKPAEAAPAEEAKPAEAKAD